jgi:hypothetical protein
MANIIPSSYLPVASQPWGREIQKRLESLESNFSLQKTNTNTVDSQLQSSYKRLDETVRSLGTINVDIANITTISNQAVAIANSAIAALNTLSSPGSSYTIDAGNVTSGTMAQARVANLTSDLALKANAASPSISGVTTIANASTVPSTNPTGGGFLYSSGGALLWRGSSGTITLIANA